MINNIWVPINLKSEIFNTVAVQDSRPIGCFKFNDVKMYMLGGVSGYIYQYSIVETGIYYENRCFDFVVEDVDPLCIYFKPDGTKMYMLGGVSGCIYQYSMSTPGDVSTLSYDQICFNLVVETVNPKEIMFKFNGRELHVLDTHSVIYVYRLPRSWDISNSIFIGV